MIRYNYIVIEGNIGAGKTSFASHLAADYDAKLILERFEDNSFLPKFYENPEMYAFPLEMSFLADRYQQLKEQLSARDLFKTFTVSDYFIDKSLIFARNNLQTDEYNLYAKLFSIISASLPKPDLILYLYATTPQLINNILKRGREYERKIQASYLENIQTGYLAHFKSIKNIPILIINTDALDFVERKKDYEELVHYLERKFDAGIHRINV